MYLGESTMGAHRAWIHGCWGQFASLTGRQGKLN